SIRPVPRVTLFPYTTLFRSGRERRRIAVPTGPGGEAVHMSARTPEAEPLLTPAEVATMFRVDPKTVTRWAKAGKLTSIRTLGGQDRKSTRLNSSHEWISYAV